MERRESKDPVPGAKWRMQTLVRGVQRNDHNQGEERNHLGESQCCDSPARKIIRCREDDAQDGTPEGEAGSRQWQHMVGAIGERGRVGGEDGEDAWVSGPLDLRCEWPTVLRHKR